MLAMDIGSLMYFGALALWSGAVAYFILEKFFPQPAVEETTERVRSDIAFPIHVPAPEKVEALPAQPMPDYQLTEGFKAFQSGAELTVEDIVKGLSRRD